MEGARIWGVLAGDGDEPPVAYLERGVTVDEATLQGLGELAPTEVFRFTAKCGQSGCGHFHGGVCTLADRMYDFLAPVVTEPPACTVRPTCRWFAQRGPEICLRCPQVATLNVQSDDHALRDAARPPGGASRRASTPKAPGA